MFENVIEIHPIYGNGLCKPDGCVGVYCECGNILYIKEPELLDWHLIKCPICEKEIMIYCGRKGEPWK